MDFIVQSQSVAPSTLAMLAARAGAGAIIPFGAGTPPAYRFPGVAKDDALLAVAMEAGCDAAFVPDTRRLADVRLVAMDMDSTLITIECIDEIADMQGIKPAVAAITESAMRGDIEFAESLRRRVALLAGLPVAVLERVYERTPASLRRRGTDAERIRRNRSKDGAALRRIHVFHRPPEGAPQARLYDLQLARQSSTAS